MTHPVTEILSYGEEESQRHFAVYSPEEGENFWKAYEVDSADTENFSVIGTLLEGQTYLLLKRKIEIYTRVN